MSSVKRMNRIALAELRKVIIVWTTNLSKRQIVIIDAKSFKVIPATDAIRWAVERMAHEWTMVIAAVGIEPRGRCNFHVEWLDIEAGFHHHSNLIAGFNAQHERLLNSINAKFERGAMWMASITDIDYTQEQLDKIWSLR